MIDSWFSLSRQMFSLSGEIMKLGVESQFVIFQRAVRLQGGGVVAQREAARMFTEKVIAVGSETLLAVGGIATGRSPQSLMQSTVKSYRRKVSANRRRLARKKK